MAVERLRRRASPGVRLRTTLVAVVAVATVLTAMAIAMVWFVGRTLTDQVRMAASLRAAQVAETGGEIPPIDPEDEFVQMLVVGEVVASSPNVDGLPPLVTLEPGRSTTMEEVPIDDGPFLVAAEAGDGAVVLVGRSIEDVREATSAVAVALLVGVPVITGAVGMLTWVLVGRALAPIDAMRAEADRISAAALDRRLPEIGTRDEVGRLSHTLNHMLARLESAQTRQRRFVSDASHELRSPIASIRQHAEVTRATEGSARELAALVLGEVERLQRLVDDLLLLAKLDEAGPEVTEDVDVDDLVLAEAARLRDQTALEVVTTGVAAGRVVGNGAQLGQLFRNLVDNAARHAAGTIALGVEVADGRVVATVDDDGPGIEEGERERVFERFVRLDEGRGRASGGAGLGLAIARDVARAHGGDVAAETSPLGGARMRVVLPAGPRAGRPAGSVTGASPGS